MNFLPALTALLGAIVAFRQSAPKAFLDIYLPVLYLLPMYYRWILPAIPDPTFEQATILPIAFAYFREPKRWRWSLMDFFVFGLAACIGYSEYQNTGYKEAQNRMFDMLASVVLPYVLAKGIIEPYGLRVPFAKRFVFLLFCISVVSVYEFRFGWTPWLLMNRLFPGQGEEWVTTFRYGFARIAGPYGHAILAGLILNIGLRIQRWLEWSGHWEPRFKKLEWLNISKARLITLGLLGGVIMTMVRGPWLGGFIAAALTAVGRTRNRKRALQLTLLGIVAAGIPAGIVFYSYASVGRAHALTASQETAAYRKELLDKYVDIALKHLEWGYGQNTWPKVPGMPSIDNYYLLLTLMHGIFAVSFLLCIMFLMVIRLVRFELRQPAGVPRGSSLGFTLAGVFIAIFVTLATVYMGLQAIPTFAILTGWAEGYLLAPPVSKSALTPQVLQMKTPFVFRRIVA